jgi:hypothetical protein
MMLLLPGVLASQKVGAANISQDGAIPARQHSSATECRWGACCCHTAGVTDPELNADALALNDMR